MAPPSITFSPRDGRFRYTTTGKLVSAAQVRVELDKSLVATSQRMRLLGDDLRAGRISLDRWRLEMRQGIKEVHLRSAALARGGWNQMDAAAFGRTGQIIRREYGFLEQWVTDIKTGLPLDGRLTTRSQLYVNAGRGTFHQVQAEEMVKRGMELERSVRHPAESCQQCVDEEASGFRPVGVMVPIGDRTCGRNCRCSVVYQRREAA